MTSSRAVRPTSGRVRAALDWYLRDPRTGRVVLYERPNTLIHLTAAVTTAGRVLRTTRVVEPGGTADAAIDRVRTALLIWWSVDELVRGTTPYRRTIGGVVLAVTLVRAVRTERRRAWDVA